MTSTKKFPQIAAGLAAAGGAFCVGTALGWSSPASPRLVEEEQYFSITPDQFNWIASTVTVGCAISCIPIGYLMNKIGRKWTMMALVIPFLLGWGLIIWAQNFAMMVSGRFFLGLAGGAFCISAPQYSAEIAEKEIRGAIGSFFQLLISLGILFSYIVGAFMSVFWLSALCGIMPLIFAITFIGMPESPTYLVIKNREAEAAKSLKWLRGKHYDPTDEIDALKASLSDEINAKVPFSIAIKERASISALVIGLGLLYFQQMCAINAILFYATDIFAAANVGIEADISTIIIGVIQVFSSFMASVLVDRLGRRVLLLGSIIVMTITLFAIGTFFFIQSVDPDTAASLGWLPLTSLCVYILAFPVGFGGIPWLVVSEIAPKKMKGFVGPIIGFFAWALAFLITLSFNNITALIGTGETFYMFAGGSLVGIFFTLFVVPETKGRSLAEIEDLLNHGGRKEK